MTGLVQAPLGGRDSIGIGIKHMNQVSARQAQFCRSIGVIRPQLYNQTTL